MLPLFASSHTWLILTPSIVFWLLKRWYVHSSSPPKSIYWLLNRHFDSSIFSVSLHPNNICIFVRTVICVFWLLKRHIVHLWCLHNLLHMSFFFILTVLCSSFLQPPLCLQEQSLHSLLSQSLWGPCLYYQPWQCLLLAKFTSSHWSTSSDQYILSFQCKLDLVWKIPDPLLVDPSIQLFHICASLTFSWWCYLWPTMWICSLHQPSWQQHVWSQPW